MKVHLYFFNILYIYLYNYFYPHQGIVVSSPWEVDGQCWTDWFNDDDPSIDGDSETLTDLLTAHPDQICLEPIEIQVRTESGENMESTGDVIFV